MCQEPEVILVDLEDRPLGSLGKAEAHRSPRLHRAFSVFLYQGDRLLLQQRALHKYHSGGLWANACCSHPRPGQDLLEAAGQRLQEECGITGVALSEAFCFVYLAQFGPQLYEYEYDHVLLGEYDGVPLRPNPEEIAQLRWPTAAELRRELLQNPQHYAPWLITSAPRVLEILGL